MALSRHPFAVLSQAPTLPSSCPSCARLWTFGNARLPQTETRHVPSARIPSASGTMVHETCRMGERAKPSSSPTTSTCWASARATSHGVGSHDFRSLIATGSPLASARRGVTAHRVPEGAAWRPGRLAAMSCNGSTAARRREAAEIRASSRRRVHVFISTYGRVDGMNVPGRYLGEFRKTWAHWG
jgi:hypothetical protein